MSEMQSEPGHEHQGQAGVGAPPPSETAPPRYRDLDDFDPRRKSPRSAVFLSVIPGLGQFYVGYYLRAFAIVGALMLFVMLANAGPDLEAVGILGTVFVWIYNLVDAGRIAALYNHAVEGGRKIDLPEDFKLPKMGGSIAGGIALVVISGIALSHTLFGYSLRWLDDWWPIFPLAVGVYLLVRGVLDQINARQPARSRGEASAGAE